MKFIEMTGHALMSMIEPDEVSPEKLQQVGLTDTCLVRVNEQGDVEVRRHDRWDLIKRPSWRVCPTGRACQRPHVGLKSVGSSVLYRAGRDESIDYTNWPAILSC